MRPTGVLFPDHLCLTEIGPSRLKTKFRASSSAFLARPSTVLVFELGQNRHALECEQIEDATCRPRPTAQKLPANSRAVISHSIERAVVVVGDQHRAILEDQ